MDETELRLLQQNIEIKQKRLIKFPSFLAPAEPHDIVADIVWIKGELIKLVQLKKQIKSLLYSPYSAELLNEWRDPSPQLSVWATQLRKIAAATSYWRRGVRLSGSGIKP